MPALPAGLEAGVVVVQHIAAGFTRPLVELLNERARIDVREAEDGALIEAGVVLVSPADAHLTVVERNGELRTRLSPEPLEALFRPSADVLFHSIADCCPNETCAVILTGMGDDAARGLSAIRESGGWTIAQDRETSVIYGMPRRAVELDGVDVSLPLGEIAAEIVRAVSTDSVESGL